MTCRRHAPLILAALLSTAPFIASSADPSYGPFVTNPFGLAPPGGVTLCCAFADMNNDGDRDVILGNNSGELFLRINNGNSSKPAFGQLLKGVFGLSTSGSTFVTPAFVDINGDGDLDFFFGDGAGNIRFQESTAGTVYPMFAAPLTNPFGLVDVGSSSVPEFADIDGDGDRDLFTGRSTGDVVFFRNTGNSTNPAFAAPVVNPMGLTTIGTYSALAIADLDADGDLDLLRSDSDYSGLYFCRNTGNSTNPLFAAPVTAPFGLANAGNYARPEIVDLDNDGDLDVVSVDGAGASRFFENYPDLTPPAVASFVLTGPVNTDADVVSFNVNFTELVGTSFTASDVVVGGPASTHFVAPNPSDPNYIVHVRFNDPDADGQAFLNIGIASFADLSGNVATTGVSSAWYNIENYPSGDVNKDGTVNLVDVALLADANLGLATLP